jgi:hypothetical protein
MAFPLVIWERARVLLMGGYRPDEVTSNLAVEFANYLDEFQLEDLPKLVKSAHRQMEIVQSRYGEQRENTRQQSATVAPTQPKQSNDDRAEESGTSR